MVGSGRTPAGSVATARGAWGRAVSWSTSRTDPLDICVFLFCFSLRGSFCLSQRTAQRQNGKEDHYWEQTKHLNRMHSESYIKHHYWNKRVLKTFFNSLMSPVTQGDLLLPGAAGLVPDNCNLSTRRQKCSSLS